MRLLPLFSVVAWHVVSFHFATCSLSNDTAKNYTESVRLFGQASFKAIYEKQPGNIIYSPAGASMALAMLGAGAGWATREQIVRGLRVPRNTTKGDLYNFVKGLNSSRDYELRMAMKLFYNKDRTPNKDFISFTQKIFEASPQRVDFGRSDKASEIINDWCAAQTNQRIKKIIDPDDISDNTEILLFNAMYFKGDWKTPFNPNEIMVINFHVNKNTTRKVQTMWANREFSYGSLPQVDAEWIEIPYAVTPNTPPGDALSMFIILPNKMNGLFDLMKNFHEIDLNSLFSNKSGLATLFMPKFKLESEINLRKPLETLGFVSMFTRFANLSGIVEGRRIFVERVVQKVLIEVDEKGAEAAAAPETSGQDLGAGTIFVVDHPFVALIMKGDRTPLFTAVINDPGACWLTTGGDSRAFRVAYLPAPFVAL